MVGVATCANPSFWVRTTAAAEAPTFELDIQPLLTRYGCNSGPCHGKSRGQNGFSLSLLGFDSEFDYEAITRAARGRRISPQSATQSLMLLKATAEVPHGGGVRFAVGSDPYRLLSEWIRQGAPRTPDDAPKLVSVRVEPSRQSLAPEQQIVLRVIATYSDDSQRDVTSAAAFRSNDSTIAAVTDDGVLEAGPVPGETAVMVRYCNHIAVCDVTIPLPGELAADVYAKLPRKNAIDELVWNKLQLLGMLPSAAAADATFVRRAYLRAIGRLPTPEETQTFLADSGDDKRDRLIDHLLVQPEYADFWANKWADLLRPNPYRVGMKAVWMLDSWLRDAFRRNMPYDQFARELITAQGSTWQNGATVIFRDRPDTVEIASSVSQLFLGVRLECAKCHHHPFEVWSQDDFFGFAAFFARVGHHGGLSPPISGGEELIFTKKSGELKHGRTGKTVPPRTLHGDPQEFGADEDPRESLVNWMTESTNPFFAKVMANRVWAEIMGQGLVEPVDDMRLTNPPVNVPLLDFLAEDFRRHNYDIKHLIRTIMTSHVFALSSVPNDRNESDIRNFSRYYRQRLRAEVLLDAINDVLDTEEEFDAMPPGSRATQVWTHRSSSLFLDTFGRPDANQDPPCERSFDSTTPQVLHLMNSPELNRKLVRDNARPARIAASDAANADIVRQAYLVTYCRPPTETETTRAIAHLDASAEDRRKAVEDLFWALINTPEFLFID
ncbi:MAG: DUF1553 domain-containing protein [Planctomycetales bacterium]|nr:DUF1553 domain-containing protein [Planctomycetales bacterium]